MKALRGTAGQRIFYYLSLIRSRGVPFWCGGNYQYMKDVNVADADAKRTV
jgi:hypothetical protein